MGKLLLITGGSTGIGAAIALQAAREGWNLAINYHSSADAAREVAEQARGFGVSAKTFQADMADPAAVDSMFAALDSRFGRLDGLVNNAGIVATAARVEQISPERLAQIFRINLFGAFQAAGMAVRRMSTARGGTGGAIVNITSAAARLGGAGQYVDYAASKAALEALTTGLAQEVAREGIRVNSLRPGIIDTAIHGKGGQPNRADTAAPDLPMGRAGTAEEVAEAAIWLLSDAASYVTGSCLDVTGGR